MTCTPLTEPLRHLLIRLAGTTGAPADSLNRDLLEQARRSDWIHELSGRVALTGAGAYHAGEISGGMLVDRSGPSPLPAAPPGRAG